MSGSGFLPIGWRDWPDHRGRLLVRSEERDPGIVLRWTTNKYGSDVTVLVTLRIESQWTQVNFIELEVLRREVRVFFKVNRGLRRVPKQQERPVWYLRVPLNYPVNRTRGSAPLDSPLFGRDDLVGNFASEKDAIDRAIELVRGCEATQRLQGKL